MSEWRFGVEKVRFPQNIENLEDRKYLGKSRTSFVEHPDAILFSRISHEGVFQQPRDLSPIDINSPFQNGRRRSHTQSVSPFRLPPSDFATQSH